MITKELAAIFALHVYDERVDPINLPKVPTSWTRIDPNPLLPTVTNGFAIIDTCAHTDINGNTPIVQPGKSGLV